MFLSLPDPLLLEWIRTWIRFRSLPSTSKRNFKKTLISTLLSLFFNFYLWSCGVDPDWFLAEPDPTFQLVSDPDSYRDTKKWRKNRTVKRNFEKKYTNEEDQEAGRRYFWKDGPWFPGLARPLPWPVCLVPSQPVEGRVLFNYRIRKWSRLKHFMALRKMEENSNEHKIY